MADIAPIRDDDKLDADRFLPPGPRPLDLAERVRLDAELERLAPTLADLLDDVAALLTRYVAFPSDEAVTAVALWIAHTWTVEAFETTPRLAIISPELGSGKTRLLEVLELVCAVPMFASNVSAAVFFRVIEKSQPTLLLDEADAIFGSKQVEQLHEDLRQLLNAGYRRGASVYRIVKQGARMDAKEFPVFTPVAIASIGDLPATVMSRSVLIPMRRRRPDEIVDQFRTREARERAVPTAEALEQWALDAVDRLRTARPEMPDGVTDRAADIYEPLLAIADEAGGPWPAMARAAAKALTGQLTDREPSIGVRLLSDIRAVLAAGQFDRLASQALCDRLAHIEEAPWGDWYGKPIDPRALARKLKPFDVRPRGIRLEDGSTPKGYLLEDFRDAFDRYLPDLAATAATTATTQPAQGDFLEGLTATHPQQPPQVADENPVVAHVADVADIESGSHGS